MKKKILKAGMILLIVSLVLWMLPGMLSADFSDGASGPGSITIHKTADGFHSGDFVFEIFRAQSGWTSKGTVTIPHDGGQITLENLKLDGWKIKEVGTNGADGVEFSLSSAPTATPGTYNVETGRFDLTSGSKHQDVYFDNFKADPSISITKEASPDPVVCPGTISYTITVENTGNVALANVLVTDTMTDLGDSPSSLDPGGVKQFQYDYQCAECPDGGIISNTATVTADGGIEESASKDVQCTEPEPEYVSIYLEKTTDGPYTSGDFVFEILRAKSGGPITIGSTDYVIERTVTIPYTGGNTTIEELPPDGYIVRETENLGSTQVDWSFGTPELEGIINDTTSQFRLDEAGQSKNVFFLNYKPATGCITIGKELTGDIPEGLDGTFEFAVYDNPEGSGDPVATASITYIDGVADPDHAVVCGLQLGTTYYVEETGGPGTNVTEGLVNGMLEVQPCLVVQREGIKLAAADADADGDLPECYVVFTNNFEGGDGDGDGDGDADGDGDGDADADGDGDGDVTVAAETGEVEVLAFTGFNQIYYILGLGIMLIGAAGSMLLSRKLRRKEN